MIPILILLGVSLALPLSYAWRIWRLDQPGRGAWLLLVAEALVVCLLVLLLARWDIAGLWTRWGLAVIVGLCVLRSWRRHRARPWRAPDGPAPRRLWPNAVSLAILVAALVWIALAMVLRHDPRPLGFPLRGGAFVVAQGGDRRLLNYHNPHPEQRYAQDITAVGPAGFRAAGLLPADLTRYAIFGAEVISPCAGTVAEARDGLPDQTPPKADPDNASGNHVVLDCEGLRVTLAHLRQGSVAVATGDRVARGAALGRVGNSGNTTEPHLHVHAVDAGTRAPVEIAYEGRVPVRNAVFRR